MGGSCGVSARGTAWGLGGSVQRLWIRGTDDRVEHHAPLSATRGCGRHGEWGERVGVDRAARAEGSALQRTYARIGTGSLALFSPTGRIMQRDRVRRVKDCCRHCSCCIGPCVHKRSAVRWRQHQESGHGDSDPLVAYTPVAGASPRSSMLFVVKPWRNLRASAPCTSSTPRFSSSVHESLDSLHTAMPARIAEQPSRRARTKNHHCPKGSHRSQKS
jgi:hypothetical protein